MTWKRERKNNMKVESTGRDKTNQKYMRKTSL